MLRLGVTCILKSTIYLSSTRQKQSNVQQYSIWTSSAAADVNLFYFVVIDRRDGLGPPTACSIYMTSRWTSWSPVHLRSLWTALQGRDRNREMSGAVCDAAAALRCSVRVWIRWRMGRGNVARSVNMLKDGEGQMSPGVQLHRNFGSCCWLSDHLIKFAKECCIEWVLSNIKYA